MLVDLARKVLFGRSGPWQHRRWRHSTNNLMCGKFWIGAALIAATIAGNETCAAEPARSRLAFVDSRQVDVELVLAVDISYSMDPDELALQREGYAQAITSSDFINAVRGGPNGRIAIAYFEWASHADQRIVIPWRIIDGPATATAAATEIMASPIRRGSRTSISGAIDFGTQMLTENSFTGLRQVIDISGDGPNNQGEPVLNARESALKLGIVINGLPIMLKRPVSSALEIEDLDVYFENCVTGGPGSFVVPVKERAKFAEAIRTKMVQEVADRGKGPAMLIAAKARDVSCTVGEQLWRDRHQSKP
jgi:hypothetical protein